jgi:hypothetical protein
MSDPDDSALWPLSDFDSLRNASATTHVGLQRHTHLSSTFHAELRQLDRRRESTDALEVIAACVRLREPALVYLQCNDRVWPVTLFPEQMVYHSPRNLLLGTRRELCKLTTIDVEPPGVMPPGHWMHDRIAAPDTYHALTPALWMLALDGPRTDLLHEVAGAAAFRVLRNPAAQELPTPGALGPAIKRMRQESLPLRKIAALPGMSTERASRLINALYITSNLIVSRANHAADPGVVRWLFSRRSH